MGGLGTHLLETVLHDLGPVVDGQDDVLYPDSSESLYLVQDHGLVCELDQRFWQGEGLQEAHVSCCVRLGYVTHWADLLGGHGKDGRTKGRRRVPKPPTRIRAVQKSQLRSAVAPDLTRITCLPFILGPGKRT